MSKIITTVDKAVYDSLYNLQSYTEKSLQSWIAKYKQILFPDYYCFLSGYNFYNKKGDRSAADLILIARDFTEWIIIEVELAVKELPHTKFQLGVFTDLKLDVDGFSKHCQQKEHTFHKLYQKELKSCLSLTPKVLVIFDYEDKNKVEELISAFSSIQVGYCELYKTLKHNAIILRIYGHNNYVIKESVYLTPGNTNKSVYEISDTGFFKKINTPRIDFVCEGRVGYLSIIKVGTKIKVKIDDHPYKEDSILILDKAISNQIFLKAVNPN
ncbi:MAG: hypothetical protein M3004_00075 [Bacteroidota bacterium]|nr:hypothetical protein [Bacteroidota bacterium]